MWNLLQSRPLGELSWRRIGLFVLAMTMALFGMLSIITTTAWAQEGAEREIKVVWSGENLTYDEITLTKSASPQNDNNLPRLDPTLCGGTVYYSPVRNGRSPTANDSADETYKWLSVVCLDVDDDGSDKSQSRDAMLFEYRLRIDQYSEAESRRQFTDSFRFQIVIPAAATAAADEGEAATSCDSTLFRGAGWIICPITNLLADGMDALYKQLQRFLIVQPILDDQSSVLFRAWGFMRNLANALFVVGFLVIIYSQVTSLGLSNYGIKRLLPRLVLAAVLVNVSYWVVAFFVDASNLAGVALQQMFEAMRTSLVVEESNDFDPFSWSSVATVALGGGLLTAAAVSGTIFALIPMLAIAAVSILVALVIMTARQALITILVIISPLAFVAWLLPNTEKYFDRWKDLLITMLLVFPLFSVVFGGSQLAAAAIIQNAKGDLFLVILGLGVQVAPLLITPLLIKLSGSVISRIAGFVNNPNKGLIDRANKYADGERSYAKLRGKSKWSELNEDKTFRRQGLIADARRRMINREANRAQEVKTLEQQIEAGRLSTTKAVEGDLRYRVADQEVKGRQQRLETAFTEAESGEVSSVYRGINPNRVTALVNTAHDDALFISANSIRKQLASEEHRARVNQAYLNNTETIEGQMIREYAGGIQGTRGATRVRNLAEEGESKERESRINAALATLGRQEATYEEAYSLAFGQVPVSGRFAELVNDVEARAAAIRQLGNNAPQFKLHDLQENLDLSRLAAGDARELRSEFAGMITKRKPYWLSETRRTEMVEGRLDPMFNGESGRNLMIEDALNKFTLDAEKMVTSDRDDLAKTRDWLLANQLSLSTEARDRIKKDLDVAYTDHRFSGRMDKRRIELDEIRSTMGLPPIL